MNWLDVEKKLEELRIRFRELEWMIDQLPDWDQREFIQRKEKLDSKMNELEELKVLYEFLNLLGMV